MHPHITQYRKDCAATQRFGGSQNEQSIRQDFINLINAFAKDRRLKLIPELRDIVKPF